MEALLQLLQQPQDVREQIMDVMSNNYGEQEGENSQLETQHSLFSDIFERPVMAATHGTGNTSSATSAGASSSTTVGTSGDDMSSNGVALEVLNMFMSINKGNADGELIHEKNGNKVFYVQNGNNHRYTINKELQVDVNTYNSEVYFHVRRKFAKEGKQKDSVSIRVTLFPVFEIIYAHVAPKIQNLLLGKNIDPKILDLCNKIASQSK
jgi:hypothetical protein